MQKKEEYIFIDLDKVVAICANCKHKNNNKIHLNNNNKKTNLENLFFYSQKTIPTEIELECIIKNLDSKCINDCIKKSNTFCLDNIENLVLLSLQKNKF